MEPPAARLEVGADFAERYRVLRCIKQGGMGSVYEVLDKRTDRLRALKVMLPEVAKDADLRARFEREASVVGRVRSDHLVEIVDAGICDPDTPFLVMELLQGEDLGARLERGALPVEDALSLLDQIALGLDKVHEEGVVHRDLKPENVFVTRRDDGTDHVKLLDFGVAKVVDYAGSLKTTRSLGTPLYMAPEQLTGDGTIGHAADLYALAHVAFAMLAGKPYWFEEARDASNAWSFISVVVRGAVEPASERARRLDGAFPAAFDRWFAKATDKRPSRRFESAREQVLALREALGVAAPARVGGAPPPPRRRSSARLVVLLAVTIVGLGALALVSSALDRDGAKMAPTESAAPGEDAPAVTSASSSSAPAVSATPVGVAPQPSATPRDTSSGSVQPRSLAPTGRAATATATAKRDPLDDY